MITHVELRLLPTDLQQVVLAKYRVALMEPTTHLTYQEAAWLYGYTYQTVRRYVSCGRLRTTKGRRITHGAMRSYLRTLQPGHKRLAQRKAQLQLPA